MSNKCVRPGRKKIRIITKSVRLNGDVDFHDDFAIYTYEYIHRVHSSTLSVQKFRHSCCSKEQNVSSYVTKIKI